MLIFKGWYQYLIAFISLCKASYTVLTEKNSSINYIYNHNYNNEFYIINIYATYFTDSGNVSVGGSCHHIYAEYWPMISKFILRNHCKNWHNVDFKDML